MKDSIQIEEARGSDCRDVVADTEKPNRNHDIQTDDALSKTPKGQHISKDGKWESNRHWRKGLIRYIPTQVFFGRIKYKGKPVRRSLLTKEYRQADDRLPGFVKEWKKEIDDRLAGSSKPQPTNWSEAQEHFLADSRDKAIRNEYMWHTVQYHKMIAGKILFFWPSLMERPVQQISQQEVADFLTEAAGGAGRFSPEPYSKGYGKKERDYKRGKVCSSQYNIMKWVGAQITARAITTDIKKGLPEFENPWLTVADMPVNKNPPDLPSNLEFAAILNDILNAPRSGRRSGGLPITREHVLINWACTKFIGMFGTRIGELLGGTSRHHPDDGRHPGLRWKHLHENADLPFIIIHNEKKRRKRKDWRKIRVIPCVAAGAVEFLKELRSRCYRGDPEALVFEGVSRQTGVNYFLETTCERLAFKRIDPDGTSRVLRITQKDLRHYFVTACIEAGASFLAISKWVGHSTTKYIEEVYGHLRPEYSFGMTGKVNILPVPAPTLEQRLRIGGKEYTLAELEIKITAAEAAENHASTAALGQTVAQPKTDQPERSISSPGADSKKESSHTRRPVVVNGIALTDEQVDKLFLEILASRTQ